MAVGVAADLIRAALAEVREVGQPQRAAAERQVHRQLVSEGGRVEGRRDADVMIAVPQRKDLVVALPVGWREHHPYQRNIHLVAEHQRLLPQTEAPEEGRRGREVHLGNRLCGVVAVTGVIESAKGSAHLGTEEHTEGAASRCREGRRCHDGRATEAIVPCGIEVYDTSEVSSLFGSVLGGSEVRLQQRLEGDTRVQQVGDTLGAEEEVQLQTAVVEGREVGVLLTGSTNAEEGGTRRPAEGRGLLGCNRVATQQAEHTANDEKEAVHSSKRLNCPVRGSMTG